MRPREKFDPDRDYLANKIFSVQKTDYVHGDLFNKSSVNVRRLRQMYEARFLTMAPPKPANATPLAPVKPTMPNFSALSEHGLKAWLTNNGVSPSPRLKLPALITKAEARWKELNNGESDSIPASGSDRKRIRRPARIRYFEEDDDE